MPENKMPPHKTKVLPHTPGPWNILSLREAAPWISAGPLDLAVVLRTDPQTREELPVQANAALMMAAPDLRQSVEALRFLVLCMATGPGWTPELVIDALTFAEAALAKAGVPAPEGQWDFLKQGTTR